MAIFKWSSEYSVGIAEIDRQHQKLVEIINRLFEAMSKGQGDTVLTQTMNELTSYTQTHFTYEEKLLEKNGYPGLAAHKVVHTKMIATLKDLEKKVASKNAIVALEVGNFLKSWLVDHIMGIDKQYMGHMAAQGVR